MTIQIDGREVEIMIGVTEAGSPCLLVVMGIETHQLSIPTARMMAKALTDSCDKASRGLGDNDR